MVSRTRNQIVPQNLCSMVFCHILATFLLKMRQKHSFLLRHHYFCRNVGFTIEPCRNSGFTVRIVGLRSLEAWIFNMKNYNIVSKRFLFCLKVFLKGSSNLSLVSTLYKSSKLFYTYICLVHIAFWQHNTVVV